MNVRERTFIAFDGVYILLEEKAELTLLWRYI